MLVHMAYRHEWNAALERGWYETGSLVSDGFIHCSTLEQVLIPANSMYRGVQDLVLLCLDTAAIAAPIVYEDCYDAGQEFPHVYGPLNLEAVLHVVEFPPNADGSFTLPTGLEGLGIRG